jgi:hypothetical protein
MLEAAANGLGIASHPLVEHDLQSGRLVAPFGFMPAGKSYRVLHAKQAGQRQDRSVSVPDRKRRAAEPPGRGHGRPPR